MKSEEFYFQDTLQKFIFEHSPVRGEIVHLDISWQTVLDRHEYPDVLSAVMGELCAAAVLLAATLKLKGSVILQIMGKGPVKLLVVECSGDLQIRATSKWSGELNRGDFRTLVGEGQFSITLDPKDGGSPYQGIVDLEGNSVAEVMQNYMTRSEQLETRIWLASSGKHSAGFMLQKLPDSSKPELNDPDAWSRLVMLAETLQPDEILNLSAKTLIHRLYHEEDVRLFDGQPVKFHCTCTRENVASMLKMLGKEEVDSIISEREVIEVHCEFCNQGYHFDKVDAEVLFIESHSVSGSNTRH